MTSTYQLLSIARDARLEGRDAEADKVLEEVGDLAAHGRFVKRDRADSYKPRRYWSDGYGDEDVDEPVEDFRLRVGECARRLERKDWRAWMRPASTYSLKDLSHMLRDNMEVRTRYWANLLVSEPGTNRLFDVG